MEIDQSHYKQCLLSILKQIVNASFVSFDLEMSGIHRGYRFGPKAGGHNNGKPSLQQLYDDTRTAAETFQVLQVGITIVEEDREKEFYLARPYNFNVSPLFFLDNKIKDRFPERQIVFSSSAADFLQGEGFNIGKVFSEGVYYLSHAEEEETRERNRIKTHKEHAKQDTTIPSEDTKALDFYCNARRIISAWVNSPKPEYDYVNIGDPTGDLNGYQRLLVHQLVKNEFPGYRSFARAQQSFVQIEKIDPTKEAMIAAKRQTEFNTTIAKQIGLRWIFEALTGGDLSGIPTKWFYDESGTRGSEFDPDVIDKEFAEVMVALKNKRHVIVGHNLFTDMVYLYSTFVGPLPRRVDDFQERIHGLFPIVIDTKYLATEGQDSMSTISRKSLSDLLEPLKKIHTPMIVLHEEHNAYGASLGKKHEAGFDSWMTAELFVKLSSKIYADRKQLEDFEYDSDTSLTHTTILNKSKSHHSSSSEDSSTGGGAKLSYGVSEVDLIELSHETPKDIESTAMNTSLPPMWHARQMQKLNPANTNPYSVLAGSGDATGYDSEPEPSQWIPRMQSSFWHLYANKLRVNASDVGVCDLDSYSTDDGR